MKKLIMIPAFVAAIGFTACAQNINATKVPVVVMSAFQKQFKGVTAKWEKENDKYEAGFTFKGATMSATYAVNGSLQETEVDIKVVELPATILTYLKEHYKGKTIKEGAKITKSDGSVNYEAEVAGKDVIFDANGKFLKEMKD